MTMAIDEVERYQKLLEDWTWSNKTAAPKAAPSRPESTQPTQPAYQQPSAEIQSIQPVQPSRQAAPGVYQPGALLCLNGRMVAVYKQAVPEKEYHLVMVMGPNSTVKTQGIALEGYQVEEIGCLSPEIFERLQQEMRWNRDLLVFHCYSYEDVEKLPQQVVPATTQVAQQGRPAETPSATPQRREEATPEPEPEEAPTVGTLRRGHCVNVRFGDKSWSAIYWGRDDQGQVVAHKTHKQWSLMHLDLDRFGADLNIDPTIDPKVIAEIEGSLVRA